MMRNVLIIVLGVVLAVIVALLALPSFLPVDAYKERLVREVEAKTGRHLTIGGMVSLRLIPRIELTAQNVALSNPPGAESANFAAFDQLDVALGLFPLLSGNIVFDKLILVDPVIALEIDNSGHPNWVLEPNAPAPAAAAPTPAAPGGTSAIGGLTLGDVDLVNGRITYADRRKGSHYNLEKINLKIRMSNTVSPLSIKGDMVVDQVPMTLGLAADQLQSMMQGAPTPAKIGVKSDLLSFAFEGKIAGGETPQGTGSIALKIPSTAHFLAWLNQQPAPATGGLGNLAIDGELSAKGRAVAFDNAKVTFDNATASGKLAFDASVKPARLTGDLTISEIDLDPYLAADRKPSPTSPRSLQPPAAENQNWSDAPIEAGGLKALDAKVAVSLAGFRLRKLAIQQTRLELTLAGGKLLADLEDMAAYGGKGTARLAIDGAQPGLGAQLSAHFSNVAVEDLLRDAIDLDRVSGIGALDIDLNGRGHSERQLVSSLAGKGDFHFTNGAVKGLDLGALLAKAQAAQNAADIAGLVSALASDPANQKTEFTEFQGTFEIANGIATNKDLSLTGPALKAEGAGTVDLPLRRVDYRVTPHTTGANPFAVPVVITGTFEHLTYRPDLQAMLSQNAAGSKLIQRALGKDADNPAVKDALKGLLGK